MQLRQANPAAPNTEVLAASLKVMAAPGGLHGLYARVPEMEALSELRLLAVAMGDYRHSGISAERARNFLTQVTALNLDLLSGQMSEADRERPDGLGEIVNALYQFLLTRLGYESILDRLVDEVGRLSGVRDDDLHRWINPEMYGWWVGHGFLSVISRETGKIQEYEDFIRHFYACYHP
ncbi:hypothetical protein [Marinobacter halotolerans]|uniref:hypothetical protein n=1 Tax=Marinobacter halotolerans TaxID=1569211 RepID=UPI001CDA0AE2|nr:hypothetical protein [Marinobacter halotolerans]